MSPRIDWQQDVDLRALNTLGVSARARRLARCHSDTELLQALTECADDPEPPLVLGGGSNVLLVGDPQMAIIQPSLRGLRFREGSGGDVHVYAAAGESWDGLVRACCDRGLWGLENLALIPGHVGAAPVQNIGAYGVELSESLRAVEAIDRRSLRRERLPADALGFGYRDSLFKREPGRWLILGVELALSRDASPRTVYAGLAEALAEVPSPTPAQVAAVVSCIRRSKLPDPAQIGNAGSFFKNPAVPATLAQTLGEREPGLPHFDLGDGRCKLSAAWLIERAGFKGLRRGDAGISERHALVLVNHGRANGTQLLELAREVADGVETRFGVALDPEPVLVGARFREGRWA